MKLSQYNYNFTPDLLAKYPTENRDESRLMVIDRKTGKIEHRIFKDIIDYFEEKDVMILNNTKVFPARLYGNKEKTGAEIEIFLLRELNKEQRLWDVLVDPARKIRIGNKLYFGDDDLLVAEVIDNTTSRGRTLRFLFDGTYEEFRAALYKLGETPLPRWIREKVEPMMHIVDIAKEAIEAAGVKCRVQAIRGGTDGAQLSFKGLPCPNIFAGGLNFHGRHEFVPVQSMEKAMMTVVKIAELTALR